MKLYLKRTICDISFMIIGDNYELGGHYFSKEQLGTFMELYGYTPDHSLSHMEFYNDITDALLKLVEFRTSSEILEYVDWFVVSDIVEIRKQIDLLKLRSYSEVHVS